MFKCIRSQFLGTVVHLKAIADSYITDNGTLWYCLRIKFALITDVTHI